MFKTEKKKKSVKGKTDPGPILFPLKSSTVLQTDFQEPVTGLSTMW